MSLICHIIEHPAPDTLAAVEYFSDESEPELPTGKVRRTPADQRAWEAAQIAGGWAPESNTKSRGLFVGEVKSEAQRRILSMFGGDTALQLRALRKGAAITDKALAGLPLTDPEITLRAHLRAANDRIEEITAYSDWLESQPVDTDISNADWP